ncbi:WAT1-related protein [Glycine max]|nr:WAT1-related protein [Glycine max]
MEQKRCSFVTKCRDFKPHLLMVLVQFGYSFLYLITNASFDHGMNPFVYVTYRHILAAVLMFPFAYFLERNARPKLTFSLFMEIFVLSLLGVSLTINMHFASLKYTNPTFIVAMLNTIPTLTFVIAVAFRFELLDLRNSRGIAKVLGTLISLAGALIIALYKGNLMRNLWRPLIHIPGKSAAINESWLKATLKRYPAQLSLVTWMSFVGAAQSAVFTVIVEHNRSAWTIGLNIDLWSTIYGGIVVACLITYVLLWCTEKKGPVFVTMFNPLSTILVAFVAYFILGEKLYLGSIIGAFTIIIGMYLLLWGKSEQEVSQDFKPYLLMVLVQVGLSILYLITKASFNHGMSPCIVAVVVMLPFAYFLERKARPHLTFSLFVQIFVLSLLGSSLTLNIHFASLKYTNPTFLVAMLNTIPTLTFILAVALRFA